MIIMLTTMMMDITMDIMTIVGTFTTISFSPIVQRTHIMTEDTEEVILYPDIVTIETIDTTE